MLVFISRWAGRLGLGTSFGDRHELRELLLEAVQTAREQVDIVKAFLEYDPALQNTMSFVVVVDHKNLVGFIFENAQLGENLVTLNILGGETN